MASGVNTTFRQIGIAVGIAVYGTIFTSALQRQLNALSSAPSVAAPHVNRGGDQARPGGQRASLDAPELSPPARVGAARELRGFTQRPSRRERRARPRRRGLLGDADPQSGLRRPRGGPVTHPLVRPGEDIGGGDRSRDRLRGVDRGDAEPSSQRVSDRSRRSPQDSGRSSPVSTARDRARGGMGDPPPRPPPGLQSQPEPPTVRALHSLPRTIAPQGRSPCLYEPRHCRSSMLPRRPRRPERDHRWLRLSQWSRSSFKGSRRWSSWG